MRYAVLAWVAVALGSAVAVAAEASEGGKKDRPAGRARLEKLFAERLNGSVLEGSYTTRGADKDETKPDRYEIEKVSKLKGDVWLFQAKYGEQSLPPLPLNVLWAGDTPVITMDTFTIPALGTFSFRVMIHGELYAGTWQHDEKGGHMLGTIRHEDASPKKSP